MNFTPIGFYRSEAKAPYEAARQPLDRISTHGEIILEAGQQFEQALEDLEGFERIWVIYVFHHNTSHWKPKVLPPRGSDHKVGVFATRAPYRPNPIGISCVKLVKVEGLKITLEGADLLDGTPILDIKPYLPYADAFPTSKTGWLANPRRYAVPFSDAACQQVEFLQARGLGQFKDFILNQLEYDPVNSDKKRVSRQGENHVLAYKTWRVRFHLDEARQEAKVLNLFSGYSEADLANPEDRYQDKELHREFLRSFRQG